MLRHIEKLISSHHQREGGGFIVRRPLPTSGIDMIDPFLLIDEMGPVDFAPGQAVGAPAHPHRGFETVTYVLSGSTEHKDSMGNHGRLNPGDVQWMTAGAGIVHAEMPSTEMMTNGGRAHGFQIWVNLPRADKMTRPRYQQRAAEDLPIATSEDGRVWVRVIAGSALGASANIETHTPIQYLHVKLQPGARFHQPVPATHNGLLYVFEGTAQISDTTVKNGQMAVLSAGESVVLENRGEAPTELLLLSGEPLNEPVARYGPFVMGDRGEIMQAVIDYQQGRMGSIPPEIR